MKENNSRLLLIGTTLNDVIESFFMNIVQKKNTPIFLSKTLVTGNFNYTIFKPLYNLDKKIVVHELEKNNIKHFIDSSNLKNDYLRNRIRKCIIHEELFGTIKRLVDAEVLLSSWKNHISNKYKAYLTKAEAPLSLFRTLDNVIQEEVLRSFLKNNLKDDELRNLGKRVEGLKEFLTNKNSKGKFRITSEKYVIKTKNEQDFKITN